jgi:hypothetical protein
LLCFSWGWETAVGTEAAGSVLRENNENTVRNTMISGRKYSRNVKTAAFRVISKKLLVRVIGFIAPKFEDKNPCHSQDPKEIQDRIDHRESNLGSRKQDRKKVAYVGRFLQPLYQKIEQNRGSKDYREEQRPEKDVNDKFPNRHPPRWLFIGVL